MATINELTNNKDFMQGIAEAKTPSELNDVFSKNNVKLENGITIEKAFDLIKNSDESELTESDLENANGGIGLVTGALAAGAFVLGANTLIFLGKYASQTFRNITKKKR